MPQLKPRAVESEAQLQLEEQKAMLTQNSWGQFEKESIAAIIAPLNVHFLKKCYPPPLKVWLTSYIALLIS